ncbi:hypothetical protein NIIDMKKI_29270 [Mycobacterium kansasii]|uniref:tRNA synthetases class I catalytic domain-containing protein n=1 Tax=Mycobacterium kansasii TaxID=1768 RepID=A0A7G1I9M2_MYCKA|nr:hypothetical protein NIIDMKKI_29270 [Mycobacterium kansasii]
MVFCPGSEPAGARAGAATIRHRRSSGAPSDTRTQGDHVRLRDHPYDATHLGHAATYLAFDLIHRLWLDLGHDVQYVQNVTDVDDPLFERADRDGVDWRELADREVKLFRADMEALRVLPPHDYVAATEAVAEMVELIEKCWRPEPRTRSTRK